MLSSPTLQKDYEAGLKDPALLELNDEIALVNTRAKDLVRRLGAGDSSTLWKELRKTYQNLEEATETEARIRALTELGQLIKRGADEYAAWEDVGRQFDRQQRLVESQRKRMVEQHQMIAYDDFRVILVRIVDFWRERIRDREQLRDFQYLLEMNMGPGDIPLPGYGPPAREKSPPPIHEAEERMEEEPDVHANGEAGMEG